MQRYWLNFSLEAEPMNNVVATCAALALVSVAPAAHASTFVAGNNSGTTDLGSFAAGSYLISATGVVDLVGTPGSGFDLNADGVPTSPVTFSGYLDFNPSGKTTADGNPGPGGTGINIGALMGSLISVSPLGDFHAPQSNYFLLGQSSHLSLASQGHIYAQVNDTYYSNNGGGFNVSVAAVPEPATWGLMIVGFGGLGAVLRRRRSVAGLASA
jgi:hypothetical protein